MKEFKFNDWAYNDQSAREVAPMLIEKYRPKDVIDIGCGIGTWLSVFDDLGVEIFGIDGVNYTNQFKIGKESYLQVDLNGEVNIEKKYDLVICLEVAEHLPPEFAKRLVKILTKCGDRIVFSAAIPGQGGQDHLNEQWPAYWSAIFKDFGYTLKDIIRFSIWENQQIHWWYRQNILIAERGLEDIDPPCSIVHPECYGEKVRILNATLDGRIGLRPITKSFMKGMKFKLKNR